MKNTDTSKKNSANTKVTFKKRLKVVLLNLLAMAVVLVALPYFTLLWVDGYTNHGETIDVPDVCGMQLEEAVALLANEKLDYTIVERRYKAKAAENEVVMQYPASGFQVKEGRKVGLVLNTEERPKRSVPSVIQLSRLIP